MRWCLLLTGLLAAWIIGCDDYQQLDTGVDRWIVESYSDEAVAGGILATHTIYPYHFEPGRATLNPLGEQEVKVLAGGYCRCGGPLNVRRDSAVPPKLYDARVAVVKCELARHGVDIDKVAIEDGLPGGDGLSSDRVVRAMAAQGGGNHSFWSSSEPGPTEGGNY